MTANTVNVRKLPLIHSLSTVYIQAVGNIVYDSARLSHICTLSTNTSIVKYKNIIVFFCGKVTSIGG